LVWTLLGVAQSTDHDGSVRMHPGLRTVRGAYAALARGDLAMFAAHFDEQVEWQHPRGFGAPFGGTHLGAVAIVQSVFARRSDGWAGVDHAPLSFLPGADHVVALGRTTFHGFAGTSGSADFAHVWLLDEARVVGVRVFEDTAIAARFKGGGRDE
jgi:Ketosteroid isomerase-related protein